MNYKEWLNEWLTYYVKPTTKERTYKKYSRQIENYIIPQLGEYEVDNLSAHILQKFTVGLSENGLAANTINGIISVLKSSLKRAVALGIAQAQFADAIVRPKTREKQVESFSKEEQRKIEQYISDSKKDKLFGIILCLYTGLRIGELIALQWVDIDFTKGILFISKSCHDNWENGQYIKVIDAPKTECSERIIPIPKQLIARLRELKKKTTSEFIIQGKSDYGAEVRSYQRTFENILKKLSIPHKGFHALRHTFATRALEVGMDVKTLSEILGHKNPTITLKRYAHSMLEHKTEMMNRIGKLLV